MRSVGNVSELFLARVSHALGRNPAVWVFRNRSSTALFSLHGTLLETSLPVKGFRCWFSLLKTSFLVHSVGNVSELFLARVSHASGGNPAAVWVFRNRSSTALFFLHDTLKETSLLVKGFRCWFSLLKTSFLVRSVLTGSFGL